VVRPPERLRPAPRGGSAPAPTRRDRRNAGRKRQIRLTGAANDNVPSWAMRVGRVVVLGIVAALGSGPIKGIPFSGEA